jgi:hypothetical protein
MDWLTGFGRLVRLIGVDWLKRTCPYWRYTTKPTKLRPIAKSCQKSALWGRLQSRRAYRWFGGASIVLGPERFCAAGGVSAFKCRTELRTCEMEGSRRTCSMSPEKGTTPFIQMPQTWVPALLEAHQLPAHLETCPGIPGDLRPRRRGESAQYGGAEVGWLSRPSQQVRGAH